MSSRYLSPALHSGTGDNYQLRLAGSICLPEHVHLPVTLDLGSRPQYAGDVKLLSKRCNVIICFEAYSFPLQLSETVKLLWHDLEIY